MGSGGARVRSGPPPSPGSARSIQRGLEFRALDPDGYVGKVPAFPLPRLPFYRDTEDGPRVDERLTKSRQRRELALWKWAWEQPQAFAWADEPWRHYTIAQWVRTSVICENPGATAADKTAMLRLADQIGLTPEGLARNGWRIAVPEVQEVPESRSRSGVRGRFEVIENAG